MSEPSGGDILVGCLVVSFGALVCALVGGLIGATAILWLSRHVVMM